MTGDGIDFGEDLPEQCPPTEAVDDVLQQVFRLVEHNPPTEDCFKSHAAKGRPLPSTGVSPCAWASCSLFKESGALTRLSRLKKKFPYLASLTIPAESGRHTSNGVHVDFWRYATFNISSAVTSVTEV